MTAAKAITTTAGTAVSSSSSHSGSLGISWRARAARFWNMRANSTSATSPAITQLAVTPMPPS
jgi:hypothetical protein